MILKVFRMCRIKFLKVFNDWIQEWDSVNNINIESLRIWIVWIILSRTAIMDNISVVALKMIIADSEFAKIIYMSKKTAIKVFND